MIPDPGTTDRGGATPFDDLNEVVAELAAGAKDVLEDGFLGAYLQGSFAVGDADATVTWTSSSSPRTT
jgi:hypothetical protein